MKNQIGAVFTDILLIAEAFGQGPDNDLLIPLLDTAASNYDSIGKGNEFIKNKTVIADTGYFSEENFNKASEMQIDAYIPDQNFRKRDIRFESKSRHDPDYNKTFKREDFVYDKENDVMICPNGNILTLSKQTHVMKRITYKRYLEKKSYCTGCPDRKKCLRNENTHYRIYQVAIDSEGRDSIKEMIKKIDSEVGRDTYSRRMGIVEPVFANIRTQKKLVRFTLRGKNKVNIQWLLFCIVHNPGEITTFGNLSME